MESFKVMIGGVEKEVLVREPKASEIKEATKIRAKAYWKALQDKLPLANDAAKLLQESSWDEKKAAELRDLRAELAKNEDILTNPKKRESFKLGGPTDKSEGTMFRAAMRCIELRAKILSLNTVFAEAQQNTVEGYSENERLNYLLYATTVYKDSGERVFSSYEDFDASTVLTEENAEKYVVVTRAFLSYQMKVLGDYQKSTDTNPENAFFKRFNFIDKEGRFINKDGNPINSDGELLGEDGELLSKPKELIKPVPFLDNEGNPILDEGYKEELAKYEAELAKIKEKDLLALAETK